MNDQERRRFFRIDDNIFLDHQAISDDEYKSAANFSDKTYSNAFSLTADFANLNNEFHPILNNIKQSNPELAQYLELLNSKIDALGRHLFENESNLQARETTHVNLSATGIAFETTEPYKDGQALSIQLVLLPEEIGIQVYGRVINKKTPDNNTQLTCIDFEYIREEDQELIIKHNLSKQMKILRERSELE